MAQPVIYLDKSILLNFTMDFIILFLTSRLSGYRTNPWRLCAGALLGSLYILAVLLPQVPFIYNMACKVLYSCLIVVITFYPCQLKKFVVVFTYFYAISFALGGAVYGFAAMASGLHGSSSYEALANLVQVTGNLINLLVWGFPLAVIFWLTLGRWGWSSLKRGLLQAVFRLPFTISFGEAVVNLEGLVDTGNQLRDPLTKYPVVVVEAQLLLPYLPTNFAAAMAQLDLGALQSCLEGTHWERRLHLIPFISVGQQNGLMIGFVPDALTVHTPAGSINSGKVLIGLYAKELSHDGAYRALLHPDLLPVAG